LSQKGFKRTKERSGIMTLITILGIVVLIVIILVPILMYNSLVGKKNQVENAFAGIDTMLKKRYDLIPNLIAAVKQYMQHEASTLTELTRLRAKATSSTLSSDETVDLNNRLGKALKNIMVAVENYPDLKASDNFQQLQRSLNEVEEQLSAARRSFNASVTDFNNAVEMFPTNLMAGVMGYQTRKLFEIVEIERQTPDVAELFK
jgi:LemA protein